MIVTGENSSSSPWDGQARLIDGTYARTRTLQARCSRGPDWSQPELWLRDWAVYNVGLVWGAPSSQRPEALAPPYYHYNLQKGALLWASPYL